MIAGGPAADGSYVDGVIPPMNTAQLDTTYSNVLSGYSSIEKTVILQPTWDTSPIYWAPYLQAQAGVPPIPAALAASQNTLVIVQDDARVPAGVSFRACLNKNYGYNVVLNSFTAIWDHNAAPTWDTTMTWPPPAHVWNTAKRWATLETPTYMAAQSRVFPFILNRPYATTGWLGLVPTSNTDAINVYAGNPADLLHPPGSWRTIDPNPLPPTIYQRHLLQPTPPVTPEQLLGTLMSNATVGGVYARFNINTAPVDTLKTIFPDEIAQAIVNARTGGILPTGTASGRQIGVVPSYSWYPITAPPLAPALATASWATWDELLNDPIFQYAPNPGGIGFYDCSRDHRRRQRRRRRGHLCGRIPG